MLAPLAAAALALAACSKDSPTGVGSQDPSAPVAHDGLAASTAEAEGVSRTKLDKLVADAADQKSEALVVLRNGKIIYESYFGTANESIYAMSASKSFVSLAYGFMLGDHLLASLDEPVVKYDAAFDDVDPRKANVTIRHLLSQTSGLGPWRASVTGGGNDIEAYADRSPLLFAPGAGWQYSNNGIDLLSALTSKIAGKNLDAYLNEKLFAPLGIPATSWALDKNGIPYGAGELRIRAIDMAKVGQAILDGGMWKGAQVIDPNWITQSEAISSTYEPEYGLLWWRDAAPTAYALTNDLLDQWEGNGIDKSITDKLRAGTGTSFATYAEYQTFVRSMITDADRAAINTVLASGDHVPAVRIASAAPAIGYYFSGWLGQYMYVIPSKHIVAVRMRRAIEADYTSTTETNSFPAFFFDVYQLVP
jgi:CubicO group peptidase (beta-lactamase class C family)